MSVGAEGAVLAGRYRVVRPLGSGGMATVFLCEDQRLGRRVAVKRMHAHGPEEVARRFMREARLGASLNHPNVVSVFDTLTDAESVLIVMEYVHGETLADAVRRGPMRPERVLDVVDALAQALDHAHRLGVVHRDIKPANILLREDGTVKLVDLGIATAADSTRITRSGVVVGTAAYMAPEQLDAGKAGPAADIYAMAAVAFEALSGRKARAGRTPVEVAHQVATEPAPDLSVAWPGAPPALAEVVKRGMATRAEDRPGSAGQFARELRNALVSARREEDDATKPTRQVPPEPPAPPRRAPSGRPATRPSSLGRRVPVIALVAAFLALGVAIMLGALLSSGGGGENRAGGKRPSKAQPDRSAPQGTSAGAGQQRQPTTAGPGGVEPAAAGGTAEGSRLNDQGYRLIQQGRYADAVPLLERAVRAFEPGTTDRRYAYALFNLGSALRRAGRAQEAVPVLERRLRIPDQTDTVRRELEAARRAARSG
jgi:eukaryotic-like serine/threonine-protein kinase